jgi:hypothetical protein
MSKLESLVTVQYHKNQYTVVGIAHTGHKIPILLDRPVYKIIKRLDKKWYINDKNHIYCMHYRDNAWRPIYLHDIVVKLHLRTNHQENDEYGKPIIHINNIHFDNRIENLQFDVQDKDYSKNTKKKRRTIDLSEHNIKANDLPTYMWYLKPDNTHGSRFVVEIPDQLSWRSTASKKVSLRYKLEEAKKFLRHIKEIRPDIFNEYAMNGDLTDHGARLYQEYHQMIKQAGFTMNVPVQGNTDLFLIQNTTDLTNFEVYLLHNYNPEDGLLDVMATLKDYLAMMN